MTEDEWLEAIQLAESYRLQVADDHAKSMSTDNKTEHKRGDEDAESPRDRH